MSQPGVRYASEALAEFTLDATALRRGDSRSQLQSEDQSF